MALRDVMECWVVDALTEFDGRAPILRVAEYVWETHESQIRGYENALFEWQYEMRWAADQLRKKGVLGFERAGRGRSIWTLKHGPKGRHDDVPF